ncbi:MAG TPA: SGNH/GDSL hydrolase family protein [Gaiellaceae bacterium]
MRATILLALLALVVVPNAVAGGPGLLIGATEDAPKSATMTVAKAQMDLLAAAGFKAVRITQEWAPGVTVLPDTGQNVLENVAAAAKLDGITVICVVMSHGSATTPLTLEDQADFAAYAASIARAIPSFRFFVVGNEPNLNRYWLPQFNDDGSDAAAPAYTSLLAQTYDALKAVSPEITVIGGALAPRGADNPDGIRPTHSPTTFIHDMGQALRDAGRTDPVLDAFDMHPYEDNSSVAPVDGTHPNSTTIALADYDKLVASLGEAFGSYDLPIWYDEFGVETQIPVQWAESYTGTEPATVKPVDEATQAAYYRQAIELTFCQPNVQALMLFHTVDEQALGAWQSGLYYAGSTTAKASLAPTRLAMLESRRGVVTHCDGLELPVTPRIRQAGATITLNCAIDCDYTAELYRGTKLLRATHGRALGGTKKRLPFVVPKPKAPYRIRLTAVNPVNPAPPLPRVVALRHG